MDIIMTIIKKFTSPEAMITFAEASLKERQTATLHFVSDVQAVNIGYLELAFSECDKHVSSFQQDDDSLALSGFERISEKEFTTHVERLSISQALAHVTDFLKAGLIPTDRFYLSKDNELVAVSATRACLIIQSSDWDGLSEYYGQYMHPTRH